MVADCNGDGCCKFNHPTTDSSAHLKSQPNTACGCGSRACTAPVVGENTQQKPSVDVEAARSARGSEQHATRYEPWREEKESSQCMGVERQANDWGRKENVKHFV